MTRVQRFTERDCERLTRGLMPAAEVQALGADNVRAILSEKGRTQYAHIPEAVLAADDAGTRVARYVMITESALPPFDRVILIGGIQLAEFAQRGNPLLFAHGEQPLPLGTVRNIDKNAVAGRGRKKRRAMTGDADFLAAEHWEFAALAWEMVQAGILRGGSIGFDIEEEREPTKEEAIDFGIKSIFGSVATRIKLAEFSIVPLGRDPAAQVIGRVRNQYALRLKAMCEEGLCTREGADEFLERVQLSAPTTCSYHGPPAGGWASGIYAHTAQEGAMCTCGNANCDGSCGGQTTVTLGSATSTGNDLGWITGDPIEVKATAPAPEGDEGGSLQRQIDTLSSQLSALSESCAALEGTVRAQTQKLSELRYRQRASEGEFRAALSMRPDPTYQPGDGFGPLREPEPEVVDLDTLPENEQDDVMAGALLALLNKEEA